ncbi:MAG: dienelactone hydrolase family protein [Acidobacteria bacterium]|nr:dienelactone hydrolase family protein [Acidobacteriota bacterium]
MTSRRIKPTAPGPGEAAARPKPTPPGCRGGLSPSRTKPSRLAKAALRFLVGLEALAALSGGRAAGGDNPGQGGAAIVLKYGFQPGSRWVFRERFTREITGKGASTRVEGECRAQVLFVRVQDGLITTAVQRERVSVRLVRCVIDGKDRLEAERPAFDARQKERPRYQAEANRLNNRGEALHPWSALREWTSEVLFLCPELTPLPLHPVREGDTWTAGAVAFRCRLSQNETCGGNPCVKFSRSFSQGDLSGTVWFDPAAGIPRRQSFEAHYETAFGKVNETLTVDFESAATGEGPETWMDLPGIREGLECSFLLPGARVPDGVRDTLATRLKTAGETERLRILSIFHLNRLEPPPVEALAPCQGSPSPRLRALAARLLGAMPPGEVGSLRNKALADADFFVRQAAAGADPDKSPGRPAPLPDAPPFPPGSFMVPLPEGEFAGWPYVVRVPEDYRGDRPTPVLVFLSGGDGRAMVGALYTQDLVARTGFIAVFPQAPRFWWEGEAVRLVHEVLRSVSASFNVDPDRVYLVGYSNGGTGVISCARAWPDRLAAAVSVCGAGIDGPPGAAFLSNLGPVPLLFIHGEKDTVIPARASRDTVDALRKLPRQAALELTLLPGRGHDVGLGEIGGSILDFLLRHTRNPYPPRLDFQLHDLAFPRHYWVEVLEKEGGDAQVEAEAGGGRTVRLRTRGVRRLKVRLAAPLLPGVGPLTVILNDRQVFTGEFPPPGEIPVAGVDGLELEVPR